MHLSEHANFPRASFLRRLGAMVYDFLLAIAVYVFFGALGFAAFTGFIYLGFIEMNHHEHIGDLLNNTPLYQAIYQAYLLFCAASFYAIFWSKAGQTLGMRAWRIKVQYPNGQNLSLITAYARCVWSLLGVGNLAILFNGEKLALQDKLTNSEVVVLSREANQLNNWPKD